MISKWDKIWVHLRFFIKFVPFQLFSIAVTYFGVVIFLILSIWFDSALTFSIISALIIPLAILEEKTLKTKVFWIFRDDTRFNPFRKSGYAEDYETFFNGKRETLLKLFLWYHRNRCWNLLKLLGGPAGNEYLVELIENSLKFRMEPVKLSDENGFMPYENTAGLKWINKNGDEGWQVFSGIFISYLYSIFGIATLYYRIEDKLYFRHSKCVKLHGFWLFFWRFLLMFLLKWLWKRELWFTFKYESNQELGTLHFKIQWEKG